MEAVKISLDKFAQLGIEIQLKTDLATGVEDALRHYAHRVEAGRAPVAPPRFLRDETLREEEASLELAVGGGARALLEREAETHGIPVGQVLNHAVFVYLADLDAAAAARSA